MLIASMKTIIPTFSAFHCHRLPKFNNHSFLASCSQSQSTLCNNLCQIKPNFLCTKSTAGPLLPNTFTCYTQNRSFLIEPSRPLSGEIHVIVGPMFAGKTSTLLRRIQLETITGRRVAVIKSSKDSRYGLDTIVTHDGEKFPCWPLTELSSFRRKIGLVAYEKLDVIGIDEAQFFEDLHDFCREAADRDGKIIIVAGLDGDYLRRSFGSVLDIIPLADSVTKLNAQCEICGKKAFFTLRKTQDTQTELIGAADVYMPVCRQHYVGGQLVMETTKYIIETQKAHSSSL